MILEIAIGDAFGAAYEYVGKKIIAIHGYRSNPKHQNPAGRYTDDTQMSIAIAELLLNHKTWTKELIGSHFSSVLKEMIEKIMQKDFMNFYPPQKNQKILFQILIQKVINQEQQCALYRWV